MANKELYSPIHILTLVTNGIAILIGIFITIIYIKCKSLHTYPCYNKLIINLILLLDNTIRIIPLALIEEGSCEGLKWAQAFILIFLDKYFLIILTIQIVILYLGLMHTNFYFHYEKKLFIFGTILGALIGLALGGVFMSDGYNFKSDKLYLYGKNDRTYKIIIDTVFNGIFLFINVMCLIIIIINSVISSKKAKDIGLDNTNFDYNFTQALIKFIVNSITYVISYIIIYRVLSGTGFSDFTYILNCIIVDLFYCFNMVVIREICKLICHKKYKDDGEEKQNIGKLNSYGISEDSLDDDEDDI